MISPWAVGMLAAATVPAARVPGFWMVILARKSTAPSCTLRMWSTDWTVPSTWVMLSGRETKARIPEVI